MTKKSVRAGIRAVVVGLAIAVVGGSGGVVSASGATDGGQGFLALGDSVAFGHSPLLEDPWIPERFVGYPEVVAEQRGMTTTNLACPGQTAQALVSRTARDNGCFDERESAADERRAMLHTDYSGTQLDAAVEAVRSDSPPSLISIQGGANDMTWCGDEAPHPERCLDDSLPKITASLSQVVTQLRAADYRGRVVLVGYHLVPGLESQLRRVNRAVEQAARRSHVVFADTAAAFARYARRHNGDLCSTGLLIELPDGSCDLHPSPTGHRLIADAVVEAAASTPLGEGAYCKAVRSWAVEDLDPRHDEDPAWFESYWADYRAFVATAKRTAPESISRAWRTYGEHLDAQDALFEKYDYDQARLEERATRRERKLVEEPSRAVQEAFGEILSFEALTCDAWEPTPADVDFSDEAPGAYCEAVAVEDELYSPVGEAGFRPADVQDLIASEPGRTATLEARAAVVAAAPEVLKADVQALADWQVDEQVPVLERNDFDFRAILLHGTARDRQALQKTDRAIRAQFARVAAYEAQVCGS